MSRRVTEAQSPLEALGTLPFRAPVGHSPRRLQPLRHRLGVLSPRPCPLARLSLGRRRNMGISDRHQLVCFALAFWNGRDPILKERLFGLTPTNSYMKALYKYPHTENSSKKTAAGIGLISSMSCWTRGPSPKTAISTSSPSTPRRAPKTSAQFLGSGSPQVPGIGLKRCLSIFSDRIFDSRVDRGIPKLTAAPVGPDMRPRVSFSAASIMSFSCTRSLRGSSTTCCFDSGVRGDGCVNQFSSIEKISVSQSITERSMTFCSSRMFPGQGYN